MSPPVLCGVAVTCKSQSSTNSRAVSCCHLCWHTGCLTGEVLAGHQGTRAGLSAGVREERHRGKGGAAGPGVQDRELQCWFWAGNLMCVCYLQSPRQHKVVPWRSSLSA